MLDTLFYDFATLFVILDPVGTAALFGVMSRSMAPQQCRGMAYRATFLAGSILLAFAFLGDALLGTLGIGLASFRIAGGILLFLLATDMVFARQSGLRSLTATEDQEAGSREDMTVFPLAFPLIAGPGAMTSVVLLMGAASGNAWKVVAVVAVLLAVLAVVLAMLLMAPRVLRGLGMTGSNVVSRVLGIILAALAVQFVVDGLHQSPVF